MLGTLFTLDSASTTLASLGAYSSPILTDFLPAIYLVGGIAIGIGLVAFLIMIISRAMRH